MSFLKEIEQKKTALRKTDGLKNDSKLEEMIVKDEEDYFRLMKETYFEKYYEQIEEFTFKSVIIPLTLEDIKSIFEANMEFETSGNSEHDLKCIAVKIDEGIRQVKIKANSDCKVFVRLSSRSPKDAIYHLEEFSDLYQQKLQEFDDKEDLFSKLHAFYKASTGVLAVSTGTEAAELLRKSNRIQGDLKVCLDVGETMNLVIREFVQFPVKNELRGFVYKGVLTALTQYNNLAFFPEQQKTKEEVEQKVKNLMEKFITAMAGVLNSFVVDIVLYDAGKVWVVEVNPFGELAGGCLFGWSKDRAVLMGERPFEFRMVEEKPTLGYVKSEMDPRVLQIMGL
eukprot:GFUD01117232.1.p1 GENE.GFUD01117232.1~~GFUD01117232.1.p1  ORF type:complete len:339 (+),score=100.60 GFUD01117232.1:86-1102(+)